MPAFDALVAWLQGNSTTLLAFVGALVGSMLGPLATTVAARRSATATLAAADRAARAAHEVAEINQRSALDLASVNREAQRAIERDRDRRQWRRHFLEPFVEHAHRRFRAWLEFTNAVKREAPDVEIRARAADTTGDFLPPTFVWGVAPESDLGKAVLEFTAADLALQEAVPRVVEAFGSNRPKAALAMVDTLAHRLSKALDQLAVKVEEDIYAQQ